MADSEKAPKVRRPRADVLKFVDVLNREISTDVGTAYFGGSWRRGATMIGDLDVLVVLDHSMTFDLYPFPKSFQAQRKGEQIAQGDLLVDGDRIHIDFWLCWPEEVGAFLMFITGPKELNVAQRSLAIKRGYSLSQVGLFDSNGERVPGTATEKQIYAILGFDWLSPEQREAFAAPAGNLVELKVAGSGGNTYTVRVKGQQASCTCKGYEFRQYCKHITKVREELGISGALITGGLKGMT